MAEEAGSLTRLRAIMRAADPRFDRHVAMLLTGSIIAAIAEMASLGAVVPLVASASEGGGRFGWLPEVGPAGWAAIFAALVVTTAAIRMALSHLSQRAVLMAGHRVAVAVHARVLDQPYSYQVRHHSSALVAAMEQVDALVSQIGWPLVQAVAAAIVGGAIVLLLAAAQPLLTLAVVILVGALYWIFLRLFARTLARQGEAAAASYAAQVRLLQDSSGAIRDLLVDGRQSWFVDAYAASSRRRVEARSGTDMLGNAPRFVVEALAAIIGAAVVVVASRQAGGLGPLLPLLALFALAFVRLLPLAHQLFRAWANLVAGRAAIDEVAALLALPPRRSVAGEPLRLGAMLTVRDLGFAYPGAEAVLDGVSFDIHKGEWIGLTGPTGGGKSTLGDLLTGLLSPVQGRIEVDGVILNGDTVGRWQRQVAPVSQSVFLADATIADNIAFAESGAPDAARLAEATRIAQLDAWIASLPEGLATTVGEAGRRISGGQRQRIGIARALYKDASFLLLDEATNALDHETEAALLSDLRAARPGVTLVLISHREAALAACDRVFRVEGGRVTAR